MRRIPATTLLICIASITGVVVWSQSQPAGTTPADHDFVISTVTQQVLAPTTVTDKDGSYVQGLTSADFSLTDNDKPQNIVVTESIAPVSLVVAVQADAKVESVLPKIQKVGSLFETMVAGEQGEVAVIAFDHRIQTLQDFTSDTGKITDAMKKLRPGSSSSVMVDAVEAASHMLRNRPKERRRVILLIAESRDKNSSGRMRETLTDLEMNNVTVYAVNISRLFTETMTKPAYSRPDPIPATSRPMPNGSPVTPTTAAQMTGAPGYGISFAPAIAEIFRQTKAIFIENPEEVFTKYTGGKEIGFMREKVLERAVAEIGREVHNQYLIAYKPNNMEEGGYHNIRVYVQRKGLEVRTRPGYWMAAVLGQ